MAEDLKADHQLRLYGSVPFSVNDDGRSVAEIKNFIKYLQVEAVERAAASYLAASKLLASLNDALVFEATAMAKVWEGPSSVESQQALRTLHATIRELSEKFKAVGLPLETLGKRLREHQAFVENKSEAWSDNGTTFDDSMPGWYETMNAGTEWGSADELAGQHLRLINNDLLKFYEQWPYTITKVVPALKPPDLPVPDLQTDDDFEGPQIDPRTLKGPGGELQSPGIEGIGDTPSIGSDSSGFPDGSQDPAGAYPDGTYPDGGADPSDIGADGRYPDGTYPDGGQNAAGPQGADPAGADPTLTAGAARPDTSGLNAPDSRTTLEDFQRPVNWDPNSATSMPNGGSPYYTPGTGSGTGPGGNLTGLGGLPLNARSASVSGSGIPFMPMAGAGTGAEESEDKENSTWLHEDDDVWGTDTDGAVSDKIG
ncbi:hypothetical protein [Nonomuraea zeae]|uniref:WXG100 family type VII secretion target n=1 Tax=Nonomuraea zeae TaxID=1642303 RepID=A0A5S4HAT4_9ACTN|nr:hypothetical protein [Nonomuraea zeae]TMR35990.1 hypothetical protein ETD85_12265 [Nonomuraea zeae]